MRVAQRVIHMLALVRAGRRPADGEAKQHFDGVAVGGLEALALVGADSRGFGHDRYPPSVLSFRGRGQGPLPCPPLTVNTILQL